MVVVYRCDVLAIDTKKAPNQEAWGSVLAEQAGFEPAVGY